MSDADRTYLKTILEEHAKQHPDLAADEHFEIFAAEQVLKRFALDSEEIESGITRGTRDGGTDSVYFLMGRKLIREDPDLAQFQRKGIPIELVVIQASRSAGFEESKLDALLATTNDLLHVSKDISSMGSTYNAQLLEIIMRFRDTYLKLLSYMPALIITYYYVSQADAPDPNVVRKAEALKSQVQTLYSAAACDVRFIGAKELLTLFNTQTPKTINLQTTKSASSSTLGTGYVCLVPVDEYYKFIVDDAGDLRQEIFESNVRDYQGEVRVNADIQKTLATGAQDEFWWLNNGVTIIADKVTSSGDIVTIEEPEIVNGLQTSSEIFRYGKSRAPGVSDKRNLLVRVVETSDPEVRDRIIKATNSQTAIPTYALHATEAIHRRIESYFPGCGLYYERRKSYYRNRGIPVSRIVTIQFLAQSVAAIALRRPDDARARPSTVMDQHYPELFDESYPPELYRNTALLMKRVQNFLKAGALGLDKAVQSNISFHLGMYVACIALNSANPSRAEIAKIQVDQVSDELIMECYRRVRRIYDSLGGGDQVAKGPEFVERLNRDLASQVRRARQAQPARGGRPGRSP